MALLPWLIEPLDSHSDAFQSLPRAPTGRMLPVHQLLRLFGHLAELIQLPLELGPPRLLQLLGHRPHHRKGAADRRAERVAPRVIPDAKKCQKHAQCNK